MTTAPDRPVLESAKVATSLAFALNGAAFASWASRLPDVRELLDLEPGQIGTLLLVGSIGSILGLPLAGATAARVGTRNTVLFGTTITTVGLLLAGLAAGLLHSVPLTAVALFVLTFGMGQWDVAMNLEGAEVERHLGRTIMPRFHAAFSLGTVLSALLGAGLVAARVPVPLHLLATAGIVWATVVVTSRRFLPRELEHRPGTDGSEGTDGADGDPGDAAPARRGPSAWTEPRTLLIGFVTLVAAFTEGAANDWIALAFVDGYALPAWAGVLGFATFLVFMTIGRTAGTTLIDRYGRVPVLRATLALAAVGSLGVVFGTAPLAFVGAAVWGFGVSLGFPLGMSAAADDPRRAAARVSVVSTIAYGAFLVGPPALGYLGDHWGVLRALVVVSLLAFAALLAVPAVRER